MTVLTSKLCIIYKVDSQNAINTCFPHGSILMQIKPPVGKPVSNPFFFFNFIEI